MEARLIAGRLVAALTSVVLVGAGCLDASSRATGPELTVLARHDPTDTTLPFQLSGGATLVAQDFAPGFPGGKSDFGGRCSVPSDFVISFEMAATATHLGHLAGDFEHCSQVDSQTGASTLTDGVAVLTAANGDELWATYMSAEVPEGAFDEMMDFDGGTGRFTNATGEALGRAICNRANGTCEYDARGTLVYDASDRRFR